MGVGGKVSGSNGGGVGDGTRGLVGMLFSQRQKATHRLFIGRTLRAKRSTRTCHLRPEFVYIVRTALVTFLRPREAQRAYLGGATVVGSLMRP